MATFEEQLRQNYIEKIEAQIEALKIAKQSFQFGDPGAEGSIRRIAHMLRGSGATYGFPEISQSAQSVEESGEDSIISELDHLLAVLSQTSLPEQNKTSILIIDDDVSSSELLKVLLTSDDREIHVAYDASEAKKVLENQSISLILLDIILPDEDGRNFLMQLRQSPKTASTPIIVITGLVGNQPKLECLALGATHFFTKPFDLKQFAQTVTQEIEKDGPVQSNKRTDLDAGLPNRSEFCAKYENTMRADSEQRRIMAFIDIDSFSLIQDQYGNENARLAIIRTATLITEQLDEDDLLARWSGEDLVILFNNGSIPRAENRLNTALQNLQSEPVSFEGYGPITLTFSAGVSSIDASQSVDEAVLQAQRYCYIAKSEGRNCIHAERKETSLQAKTLLLAEDDELIASIIKHRLGREGFEITHHTDGESALNAAQERRFSLVILDVKMPVMDGFEVLTKLRETKEYEKSPIILLTAMGSEKDIVRGFKLGANDYILKPFSPVQLLARVQRLLKA